MRIGLLTEGTYPVARGGVTTWCEQLIEGLPDDDFIPVTLISSKEKVILDLPPNVPADEVTLIPMWGRVAGPPPLVWARHARNLTRLLERLWAAVLSPDHGPTGDQEAFTAALKELTGWQGPSLARLIDRYSSTHPILQAWERHRAANPDLPGMTLGDAAATAVFVDRMIAVADADWPEVDVSHVASNSPPALLALGRWWQRGTPIVVTEHGIYLRERHLALAETSMAWTSRYVIGRFLRMLGQATYAAARYIAPVSDFNRQWELELGADPDRTAVIYNGVDTDLYHPLEEPGEPTISFVGRIDPLKALEVLVEAFALVRRRVPAARLRLFGPTPKGNEAYHEELQAQIDALGLTEAVTFEGRVASSMQAFAAGQVVALSSISEGLPFTVIEAMMAGRATVNTDVGGVAEVVGRDGAAGIVVPPRDPRAFADALVSLLQDDALRQEIGRTARVRAMELFDLTTFLHSYRDLYRAAALGEDVAAPSPEVLSEDALTNVVPLSAGRRTVGLSSRSNGQPDGRDSVRSPR